MIKFTYFIIRLVLGSILSSVGILWSESLQSITYLKNFAYLIKDLLESLTDLKLPTIDTGKDLPESPGLISLLGLLLLGVAGFISVLFVFDYYQPDTIRSIPYLGNVIEYINNSITSTYTSISEWLFGSNSTPENSTIQAPESISRSSSGSSSGGSASSSITIRDLRPYRDPFDEIPITPPSTRPGTPIPEDMLSNWD